MMQQMIVEHPQELNNDLSAFEIGASRKELNSGRSRNSSEQKSVTTEITPRAHAFAVTPDNPRQLVAQFGKVCNNNNNNNYKTRSTQPLASRRSPPPCMASQQTSAQESGRGANMAVIRAGRPLKKIAKDAYFY